MSCSAEPRVFQMAYSSDTSQFWHHHARYKYKFHCIQARKIANTVTISGYSVNINIDCLTSNDRLEYNRLPTDSNSCKHDYKMDSCMYRGTNTYLKPYFDTSPHLKNFFFYA